MRFKIRFGVFLAALCLFSVIASTAFAADIPDRPQNYVVDLAGIIDNATQNRLNAYLKELEQKTTVQFVVLTLDSLEGESIEDLSISIAHDRWKLGQKGKDNGLLLVVAVNDRKYRIEVGYGLEGLLPDSLVGSIGRNILVPFFKKGDYSGGIFNAAAALANVIAVDAGVEITGMPTIQHRVPSQRSNQPPSLFQTIITLVVFVILLIFFIRNPKLFLLFFLFSSMGGRGNWRGGGGFGGGGFGSFGGGGGGGFGGGGASGGW